MSIKRLEGKIRKPSYVGIDCCWGNECKARHARRFCLLPLLPALGLPYCRAQQARPRPQANGWNGLFVAFWTATLIDARQ